MRGTSPVALVCLTAALAVFGFPSKLSAQGVSSEMRARELLDKYCVSCHNERLQTGGLALDRANLERAGDNAPVWEKVIVKLHARAMPPPGLPRPDQTGYQALTSYLETALDRAAATAPNPGRTDTLHRLTRFEYQNAIRDLLDLEIDAAAFLQADISDRNGFDNMSGVLSVSPTMLQSYVSAAHRISRLALGVAPPGPSVETHFVPITVVQTDQMSEELPFGSRGGISVRHYFPVDAVYELKLHLQTNYIGYVRGILGRHEVDLRMDGARIKSFTFGGDAPPGEPPASYEGNIFGATEWEKYARYLDNNMRVRMPISAGPHLIQVAFPRQHYELEGIVQPTPFGFALAVDAQRDANPSFESIQVSGPYAVTGPGNTPSRRRILVCRPKDSADEESCADKILFGLARDAYRRPLTTEDHTVLYQFYQDARKKGSFEDGLQAGLERILASPDFLFRIERDPSNATPEKPYRITNVELASRLSFLLWSSIPDRELLDAAVAGKLSNPEALKEQIRRMLADSRSNALVQNFFAQWLQLRDMRNALPDPGTFPNFDDSLRQEFQTETELFIKSQVRGDRGIPELVSANYTFLNEHLAKHYGIPDVYGSRFRRVEVTDDQHRGGLFGQGSILTVTSYPTRTSPVLRGKWLLANILGTPVPPPPPNVPALPEKAEGGRPASVRELLEQHRKNPVCASCHSQMDPLGFALENFDAVGGWRTSAVGIPIDAKAKLANGAELSGFTGLRSYIQSQPERFVSTVTEKLLTYALGREVAYYDMPAVRAVTRASAADNYSWSSIITGIVMSTPFQMRRPVGGDASSVASNRGQSANSTEVLNSKGSLKP